MKNFTPNEIFTLLCCNLRGSIFLHQYTKSFHKPLPYIPYHNRCNLEHYRRIEKQCYAFKLLEALHYCLLDYPIISLTQEMKAYLGAAWLMSIQCCSCYQRQHGQSDGVLSPLFFPSHLPFPFLLLKKHGVSQDIKSLLHCHCW